MPFSVIDDEGATIDTFESIADVKRYLRCLPDRDGLGVLEYDHLGNRIGVPLLPSDVVARPSDLVTRGILISLRLRPFELTTADLTASWAETFMTGRGAVTRRIEQPDAPVVLRRRSLSPHAMA